MRIQHHFGNSELLKDVARKMVIVNNMVEKYNEMEKSMQSAQAMQIGFDER